MEINIIEQQVYIEPKLLNKNLKNNLFKILVETTERTSSYDNGYIVRILRILDVKNNFISKTTSNTIFTITYEAEVLKPREGLTIDGIVCLVFIHGILLDVMGEIKILIPKSTMSDWVFMSDY